MPRARQYENNAARQKAYRDRKKREAITTVQPAPKAPKRTSVTVRHER